MTETREAEVGVVVIHGMGNPKPDFAAPLIDGLTIALGDDARRVAFESCFWSPILQESEEEVWRRLKKSPTRMELDTLRQWIVGALGDPTGYLSGYERRGPPVMHLVHEKFAESLATVEGKLRDPATAPIVVLAHSLGGVVVTNYLWNLERAAGEVGTTAPVHAARELSRRTFGETPVQRLETLAGLVTFGCNIPLFLPPALPYECVRIPRPGLSTGLKAVTRWLNVNDPYDVLGYPLADLWDVSNGTKIDDVALEVGPFLISKTPLSHTLYWNDAGFQSIVAGELRRVLGAVRANQ